jgi:hypothetical protein
VQGTSIAHQGRIDAARLYGQAFHLLMVGAGLRELTWAPKAYMWHKGALADTSASLNDVLSASESEPAVDGAPVGWAAFGQHIDDSAEVASSMRVVSYIIASIQNKEYGCKMVNWKKVLGYTVTVWSHRCGDAYSAVTMSCFPVIEAAIRKHITDKGAMLVRPKHPYASNITAILGPGTVCLKQDRHRAYGI